MDYLFHFYKFIILASRRCLDLFYPHIYRFMPGLTIGKNVRFWGKPLIDIRGKTTIKIGNNCQLISTNIGTHVNYGTPLKLFTDREGAYIFIGDNCSIGGACIHAYNSIKIGKNCIIGAGSVVNDANGHPTHFDHYDNRRINIDDSKPIIIHDDVWVTINCVVLPGTEIGKGSIVSANSVVHGEIPPYSIVAGNPAKVIASVKKNKHIPNFQYK